MDMEGPNKVSTPLVLCLFDFFLGHHRQAVDNSCADLSLLLSDANIKSSKQTTNKATSKEISRQNHNKTTLSFSQLLLLTLSIRSRETTKRRQPASPYQPESVCSVVGQHNPQLPLHVLLLRDHRHACFPLHFVVATID